jgi:thiol-disulfide isomerase/thioredoxin
MLSMTVLKTLSKGALRKTLLLAVLAIAQTGCVGEWFGDGSSSRPHPRARKPAPDAVLAPADTPATTDGGSATGWEPLGTPEATPEGTPPPPIGETSTPPPWSTPYDTSQPPAVPSTPPPPSPDPLPPPYSRTAPHSTDPATPVAPTGLTPATPAPYGSYPPVAAPPPSTPRPLPPGAKAAGTSDADPLYYDFMGRGIPELSSDGAWIVKGPAESMAGLRGRVVFVMFAFQTCPSCALMTPYLKQWHEMFAQQGLSIVYVNNGLMSGIDSVRDAVATQHLLFPYFHDAKGSTIVSYGVRSFPTAYLVDRTGRVIWQGPPITNEAQIQALIQDALK